MAIFAIGDIQGCLTDLERLLDRINFDPADDRLWIAGDIVNRGPESLQALRFVRKLGDSAVTVLGNHDMHLLAVAHGGERTLKSKDTLVDILNAPDADELLAWIRHQRFLHFDEELGYLMVHAGLPPQWGRDQAIACARELEAMLQGPGFEDFLAAMYGNQPDLWHPELTGNDRYRFLINCFTRMRFVDAEGRLDFANKCAPGEQPAGLYPWYAAPNRASADEHILFGHWSTAGQSGKEDYSRYNVYPLDTGCVWGGALTAFRLDEDGGWASIDCRGQLKPGQP
jgi:bis(5'-nucleosyl)-tetraphosphatase (symmetrical)